MIVKQKQPYHTFKVIVIEVFMVAISFLFIFVHLIDFTFNAIYILLNVR